MKITKEMTDKQICRKNTLYTIGKIILSGIFCFLLLVLCGAFCPQYTAEIFLIYIAIFGMKIFDNIIHGFQDLVHSLIKVKREDELKTNIKFKKHIQKMGYCCIALTAFISIFLILSYFEFLFYGIFFKDLIIVIGCGMFIALYTYQTIILSNKLYKTLIKGYNKQILGEIRMAKEVENKKQNLKNKK